MLRVTAAYICEESLSLSSAKLEKENMFLGLPSLVFMDSIATWHHVRRVCEDKESGNWIGVRQQQPIFSADGDSKPPLSKSPSAAVGLKAEVVGTPPFT